MLLEKLHEDEERIAEAGPKAIRKALEAGVAVYYIDNILGEGIIKEMPDGTRHLIVVNDGDEVILQTLASPWMGARFAAACIGRGGPHTS